MVRTKPSLGNKELDKVEEQFDEFNQSVQQMTLDRMNQAPLQETEPQTKLSQSEIEKSKEFYLKPSRYVSSREKFNENFREDYNYAKEYVRFIAEHKEIIGEKIEMWTKPFAGMPAEFWEIPTGKPIWGPRHVAESLTKCRHHRLVMKENVVTGGDEKGNQYYGSLAAQTTVQRLDAIPVSTRKSLFMSADDHKFDGRKSA